MEAIDGGNSLIAHQLDGVAVSNEVGYVLLDT